MSTQQILIDVLLGCIGAFSLAGAVMDWDWFMNSSRAAFFVKIMGRKGARIFYGLLGAALVGFAIYGAIHPEVLHSRRLGI